MDFATSSHRQRWLYTRTGLTEERRKLQERVVDGLRRQRHAAAAAGGTAGGGADGGSGGGAESPEVAGSATKRAREPPPLSALGELLMLKYYQQIIQEKCREMRMPVKVMATAILYHKRFFLRHSSMEFDPGRVMITAIFMATKVEEFYTRAADIAKSFDVTEDLVVKQEVALLEGLNFDLVVHSPYRALQGLLQELKEARAAAAAAGGAASPPGSASPPPATATATSQQQQQQQLAGLPPLDEGLLPAALPDSPGLDAAARAAFGALDALMLSDAPLLYGPAQLAAAALRSGFKAKGVRIPNFLARIAQRAALLLGGGGGGGGMEVVAAGAGAAAPLGGSASPSPSPAPPGDPAAALTAALDELDALGSEGARRVEVDEVKEANAAAREWRNLLKEAAGAAGGGGGGAGGGGGGDDAARAAKREKKRAAAAAAKAAKEAELLGMPQRQ
ncbi:hypothetical protein HYH02_007001 [Chlamydomonas schloesseri]|uniref:Cyclin-like domain-containing protein n=1 Tax=Chlamydomonas schloesseri TaxID=2026947 RepID=A0A835WI56_9CHLO|nr:hypothetical protein HYH02_007001 [Chlamydomonas schloesseri]|eukprot:KAG2447972.1 hypothetical protein HYH02_007001 [Chlamydomonas schloesseri]